MKVRKFRRTLDCVTLSPGYLVASPALTSTDWLPFNA